MIALIVRRQEIDTLNLAISCKVNIQAPIPNIVGIFWLQPVLLHQIPSSFWVRLAGKTTLTGQNLCKKDSKPKSRRMTKAFSPLWV